MPKGNTGKNEKLRMKNELKSIYNYFAISLLRYFISHQLISSLAHQFANS